jgi:uncharacterized membrane protein YkoI
MKGVYRKLEDANLQIRPRFKQQLGKKLIKLENTMVNRKTKTSIKQLFNQRAFQGALVIAILFIGTSSVVAWQAKKEVKVRQTTIEDNLQLPADLSDVLSIENIRKMAETNLPEGLSVSQIELETEDGRVVYKVKFSDGTFKLYDARTGSLFNKSEVVDVDDFVPTGFVAGITLQQARDIAAAKRPGQTIIKIELETEEGVVVYSVRFADGSRVDVNATNGTVVRIKTDDDSDSSDSSEDDEDDDGSSGSGSDSSNSGSESDDTSRDEDNDSSNSGSGSGNDN